MFFIKTINIHSLLHIAIPLNSINKLHTNIIKSQCTVKYKYAYHLRMDLFHIVKIVIGIHSIVPLPSMRVSFGFSAPGHCLVRACLLHCMRVRLPVGYMWTCAQITQHTQAHKAVTRRIKGKKLLSHQKQSHYSITNLYIRLHCFTRVCKTHEEEEENTRTFL